MAKRVSAKEHAIAFFTTAPENEVKDVLETVNVIARARGFAVGRKRTAKAEGPKPRKPRGSGKTDAPPPAGEKTADPGAQTPSTTAS